MRISQEDGLLNENGGVDSPARRAVFNSVRYHCHG